MVIKIVAVGKIKEKYINDGINEYLKRISPFCNLQIVETKEFHFQEIEKNIDLEGNAILDNLHPNDYVITLEIEGESIDSITLSNKIKELYTYQSHNLVFVIGGSNGLSLDVKKRSNYRLSFGRLTYPHQLTRLLLCEQIYRAFSIINNLKYHK